MSLLLPGRNDPSLPFRYISLTIVLTLLPAIFLLTGSNFSQGAITLPAEKLDEYNQLFFCLGVFFTCSTLVAIIGVLAYFDYAQRNEFIVPAFAIATVFSTVIETFHIAAAVGWIRSADDAIMFYWIISRVFHCLLLIAAVLVCYKLSKESDTSEDQRKTFLLFFTVIGIVTAGILYYFYSWKSFPDITYPNGLVNKPVEVFVFAGYLFLLFIGTPFVYKRYPSAFTHALFLSMLPAAFAEGNMAFSDAHFPDNNYILTLLLKELSYLLPLLGLIYTIYYSKKFTVARSDTPANDYLRIMSDVSLITNRSSSFNEAVSEVIRVITSATQFDLGNYYIYNREKRMLEPSGLWYLKQGSVNQILNEQLAGRELSIGEGIPGLVIESNKEMWVNDFTRIRQLPRVGFFEKYGIKTAFAIPVIANNAIAGVIEFFSYSQLPEDDNLMQMAPHLKFTLGHVKELEEAEILRLEQHVHLKAAQQMASIGSWSINLKTERMQWSDEMYHLREMRVQSKQVTFEDFIDTVHKDDKDRVREVLKNIKNSSEPINFEYKLITTTGKIRYMNAHAELWLDDMGIPQAVFGTSQDITLRVGAEKQYETLFRAAPDAIILMDEHGYVVSWNDKAEEMFEYSHEEALGAKLSTLIIPEQFRAAHEQGFAHFVETGQARVVGKDIETSGITKSGKTIPVSLKISRYDVGEKIIFIGFLRNLTDRKRTEKLLYSIMNSALQALLAFRTNGKSDQPSDFVLELSNQYGAALFNKANDFINEGKRLDEIFIRKDLDVLFPRIQSVMRTGSAERLTFFASELERWLDIKLVKIETGFALSAEDVTEKKIIQKKFEENKHLLQQVTDTIPSLLTVIDLKTFRPVYSNRQLAALTGYENADIKDLPDNFIRELIYKDDLEKVLELIDKLKENSDDARTFETDFRIVTIHKGLRHFNSRTKVFKRDPDGSVRLILTIIEDVTSKKIAETQLSETNTKLEAVFNQTFQLMALLDRDGSVQKVSRAALDYGMLEESEVLNKVFWEVSWWPHTGSHFTELKDMVKKALEGEFARKDLVLNDGRKLSYMDLSIKPILSDEGEIMFVIAEGRDVTTEKRAIEKIRTNEKLYRVMAENMPDSTVVLIDKSRNVQLIEGTRWDDVNFPKDKIIGYPIEEYLKGDLAERYLKYYEAAFQGKLQEFETTFNERHYKVAIIPVFDTDDDIFTVVAVYHDITPLRQYQEELEERIGELDRSNKDLEQFAYIASHDLQEPLRKIRAFGDRLASKYSQILTGDGTLYLERMESAAERMQRMIDDLLTFSRVSRPKESFTKTDLEQVVTDVLSDLEILIEKKNATVKMENDLPSIEAIPSQMRQLFQNIIGNALKFTREGVPPVVSISAEKPSPDEISKLSTEVSSRKFVKISVSDNGIGFDEKYKERIFTLFQRLHSRAEYEGTGIGLSVCKKIVEFHNGLISVHSVPGEGSTFTFYLPLYQKKN